MQGALELMVGLSDALAEVSGLPGVTLQPAAGAHGELTALMVIRAAHTATGQRAQEGHHSRHRARDQPRVGDDVRLRDGHDPLGRARSGRSRGPQGGARRGRRRLHAHEPQHAWGCSTRTSPRSPRPCTRSVPTRTATARTSTPFSARPARATWASTPCTSTCTRRSRRLTAAAAPAPAPCASPRSSRRSCPARSPVEFEDGVVRPRVAGAHHRARPLVLRQLRRAGARVRLHPRARRGRADRGRRAGGPLGELPEGAARGRVRGAVRPHVHARVRACRGGKQKRANGVRTLDMAKRLLDYGFHPPTVYFPLLVEEAHDDRADRDRAARRRSMRSPRSCSRSPRRPLPIPTW